MDLVKNKLPSAECDGVAFDNGRHFSCEMLPSLQDGVPSNSKNLEKLNLSDPPSLCDCVVRESIGFITLPSAEYDGRHFSWKMLPSDVQLKIIWDGIDGSSSWKEAIRFLRRLGFVNKFLRQFIKDNNPFLIRSIAMRNHLPMWIVAFYLGSLSRRDSNDIKHSLYSSCGSLPLASNSSSKYSPNKIQSVWDSTAEEERVFYRRQKEFYGKERQPEKRFIKATQNRTLWASHSVMCGPIYEETKEEIRERDEKYCREEMQKSLLDFILAGDYENVLGLLENRTDPNFTNKNGYTPLYVSICENHPKIAELLLTHRANPNGKDDIGCTPLIWASIKGMKPLVDCLIQNGAFLDVVDNFGLTALSKACLNNHLEIVETLLSSGADSQIKDKMGQTVYDYAIAEGNDKMIALLKEKGKAVHIMKGKEKLLSKSDGALITSKESKIISTDDFWDFGEEEENDQKSEKWIEQISTLLSSYDLTHLLALNDTLDQNLSNRTNKIKDLIQDRIRVILQI